MERLDLSGLGWLEGYWTGEAFGGAIEEAFGPPVGICMPGMSHVVRDGKVVHSEFIVLVERCGRVDYEVTFPTRHPHVFWLADWGDRFARWEDPQNLWPKSILYRLSGDALEVVLDGVTENGEPRTVAFTMLRAASTKPKRRKK